MNFYYRPLPDGRREIVCTRCFLTIGAAVETEEIRRLEENHRCAATRIPATGPLAALAAVPKRRSQGRIAFAMDSIGWVRNGMRTRGGVRSVLFVVAAAVFLYIVPNQLEFLALRHWNPYISSVLPGDVAGCVFLCVVLRRVKVGVALYCVLTAFEAGALGLHVMPVGVLPWFTDLVPTLVVGVMVLRMPGGGARLFSL